MLLTFYLFHGLSTIYVLKTVEKLSCVRMMEFPSLKKKYKNMIALRCNICASVLLMTWPRSHLSLPTHSPEFALHLKGYRHYSIAVGAKLNIDQFKHPLNVLMSLVVGLFFLSWLAKKSEFGFVLTDNNSGVLSHI